MRYFLSIDWSGHACKFLIAEIVNHKGFLTIFLYQTFAKWLTEEFLVSWNKDFRMARMRSDVPSHSHHLAKKKIRFLLLTYSNCFLIGSAESRRGREVSEMWCVGSEQFSWHAKKIPREIIRSQNPLSYPSQKKTAQRDVTAKTALKLWLRKTQQIFK